MDKLDSHVQGRRYAGDKAARDFLDALNWFEHMSQHDNPEPQRWTERGNAWVSSHTQPYIGERDRLLRVLSQMQKLERESSELGKQPDWRLVRCKLTGGPKGAPGASMQLYVLSHRTSAKIGEFEKAFHMGVKRRPFTVDWVPGQGFTFICDHPSARALLGLLELLRRGYIHRIRRCEYCRTWFFSRFEHQRFDKTRCQEDHYHTAEWRKKNRERNKRHQQEYRSRLFGHKARRKS